jgi:dynactin complex subunit
MEETKVIPTDKLVRTYIKIRDARKELADKYEQEDIRLKDALESIENELLEACKSIGADSIRTAYGTLTRSVKKRYWTNDWYSFHEFVKENEEHGAMNLLEKRIAQTNMASFLEDNPDLHPPGLNVDSRYAVVVRRK